MSEIKRNEYRFETHKVRFLDWIVCHDLTLEIHENPDEICCEQHKKYGAKVLGADIRDGHLLWGTAEFDDDKFEAVRKLADVIAGRTLRVDWTGDARDIQCPPAFDLSGVREAIS